MFRCFYHLFRGLLSLTSSIWGNDSRREWAVLSFLDGHGLHPVSYHKLGILVLDSCHPTIYQSSPVVGPLGTYCIA